MKTNNILLIAIILIGGLSIFEIAYSSYSFQIYAQQSITNQQNSFNDLIAFQGIKTYINENGNAGMFDSNRAMLYIKTNRTPKESCLTFLHELGHSLQFQEHDACYYSKNLNACEIGATQYAKDNSYRCEGLQ